MATAESGAKKRVESVERALSILEVFDQRSPKLSLAEIAKRTGLYPSTALRLAGSLEHWGYLRRDDAGGYRLGPTLWRLGSIYQDSFDFSEVVRPVLKTISEMSGETGVFYIKEDQDRICLFRHNSHHSLRHHVDEGSRLPIDRGAGGHVLAAYTGDNEQVHAETRSDGFRVSFGERAADSCAVAVPVWGQTDNLVGALALVGPRTRLTPDQIPYLVDMLRQAANRIQAHLRGKTSS